MAAGTVWAHLRKLAQEHKAVGDEPDGPWTIA